MNSCGRLCGGRNAARPQAVSLAEQPGNRGIYVHIEIYVSATAEPSAADLGGVSGPLTLMGPKLIVTMTEPCRLSCCTGH